ncbi:MAG TPA: hypothetical protein VJV78_11425 [Polyangiales bacterium]|nr:hypothetical protein [Polyangiales bacterium]
MKRALALSWVAVLCTACGLFHGADSNDGAAGQVSADAGRGDAPTAGSLGAHAGATPAAGGGGSSGGQGAGAGEEKEQVWLGEVWSPSQAMFCDPELPSGLPERPGLDPEGFTWRVLLTLDVRDANYVQGEIRFGEGVARIPERPDRDPTMATSSGGSFWDCTLQMPVEGFGYRILGGRASSKGVDFDFSPNQIWEQWCATEKPTCRTDLNAICEHIPTCQCDADECHADLRGNLRVQLSRTADTLEGHLPSPAAWGTRADIRLRRVK